MVATARERSLVLVLVVFLGVSALATSTSGATSGEGTTTVADEDSRAIIMSMASRSSSSSTLSPSPLDPGNGSVWEVKCATTELTICTKYLNSKLDKVKCVEGRCRCTDNHVFVLADNEPDTIETCLPICQEEQEPSFSIFRWLTKIFSTPERCYKGPYCNITECANKLNTTEEKVACINGICRPTVKLDESSVSEHNDGDDPLPNEMTTFSEGSETKPGMVGNDMGTTSGKRKEASSDEDDVTREISKPAGGKEPHFMSSGMEFPRSTITQQSTPMGQPSVDEPSTTMGHPSTTGQSKMDESSTTRHTTMGELLTTRQTTMSEPLITRQTTMGGTSTVGQTTMGHQSTITTAEPTNEDIKEAAPSNVDLVDAPKDGTTEQTSHDKNLMLGDQPAEDEAPKSTGNSTGETDAGEVGGVTAKSAPAPSAAAVGAPTSASTPAPTTAPAASTRATVAPSRPSASDSRLPSTLNTPQADQLGGGGSAASTFVSSIGLLSLGLFATLQLLRFT